MSPSRAWPFDAWVMSHRGFDVTTVVAGNEGTTQAQISTDAGNFFFVGSTSNGAG